MKRIIEGKEYDTEKATELHRHTSPEPIFDATAHNVLYLSPQGQSFTVHYLLGSRGDIFQERWDLLEGEVLQKWLDKFNAPRSAHEALGFPITEG